MSFRITHYDEHNPTLAIDLKNGRRIEFSVAGMEKGTPEWLGKILEDQFEREIAFAVDKAVASLQGELRRLLGVR